MKARKIKPSELFCTFALLSILGFGGVAAWVYRAIVEQKKWLDPVEFGELLGMGQILPGPNVTNFSAMLGYRFCGLRGAIAAVLGLLAPPFVLILGVGALYQRYGQLPAVQGALRGVTAVAAGLVIATGIKLALRLPRTAQAAATGAVTFIAVGILHFPLGWTILSVVPLAIAAEWRLSR